MASKSLHATSRLKAPNRATNLDSAAKMLPSNRPVNGHGGETKVPPERKATRHGQPEKKILASRGVEQQNAHNDHLKAKEQLNFIEKSKANLMQDLARARRNVDELTTKLDGVNNALKKNRVPAAERENGVLLEREDWQVELDAVKQQYELALLELQTSKQAMESLKHELMVCVEAKDEAVRLAAEAMNAAETTARRVEELSAELSSSKGGFVVSMGCTTSGLDDLIGELPETTTASLFEADESGKTVEDDNFLEGPNGEVQSMHDVAVPEGPNGEVQSMHDVDVPDMVDHKVAVNGVLDSEINTKSLTSPDEALRSELLAAKEAEGKALDAAMYLRADLERVNSEKERAKMEESAARDLFAKATQELEELKEKLAKAEVEETTLLSSLEILKTELVKKEQDLIDTQSREANANQKAAELTAGMERTMEAHQAEMMLIREKEATAHATIESLKNELQRQKLELVVAADKEAMVSAKVANMIVEIEKSRTDLMEHQEQSTYEVATLRVELETAQSKLIALEERESANVRKITSLLHDIENTQSEIRDLQETLSEMESRAETLNVELESLRDEKVKLEAKDVEASAKVAELNGYVVEIQQALDEALNASKATKEDLSSLQSSLEKAISDKDTARREAQAALLDCEMHKQAAIDAVAKAQAAKEQADSALEAASKASDKRIQEALVAAKSMDDAAQTAREEACAIKEKLQVAIKDAETARMEVVKAIKEAQSAREEVGLIEAAIIVEKERAKAAEDDVRVVSNEVESLKRELAKSQVEAMEARVAMASVESKLQSSIEELESMKASDLIDESSTDLMLCGSIPQEELDCLKQKLATCEECLLVAMNEVGALRISREELLKELEATKVEKEVNKKAVLEAHQHLVDLEKAKSVMEADIQRLLDDSKMWKTSKDTRDIPVLSEMNGLDSNLALDSREEKPQPDSPGRVSNDLVLAVVQTDVEPSKAEELVSDKEEETHAPSAGSLLPGVVKKKKHALFHRLHSYLDKKKSLHTP